MNANVLRLCRVRPFSAAMLKLRKFLLRYSLCYEILEPPIHPSVQVLAQNLNFLFISLLAQRNRTKERAPRSRSAPSFLGSQTAPGEVNASRFFFTNSVTMPCRITSLGPLDKSCHERSRMTHHFSYRIVVNTCQISAQC